MSGGGLPFRLLAIGDREQVTPTAVRTAAEAGGPALALLLRDPAALPDELRRWAGEVLPLCRASGVRLLLHGAPELAREIGADGVHLPERGPSIAAARATLGAGFWIGASRHDAAGVRAAGAAVADYATLSPVFATPGKGEPLGLERLAEICRAAPLPVIALGGITPERAESCRAAGAATVAAIRAVWTGDAGENVRHLLNGA